MGGRGWNTYTFFDASCRCLRRWARRRFGAIAVMFCDMAMPILEQTLMSHFPQTLVMESLILRTIFLDEFKTDPVQVTTRCQYD